MEELDILLPGLIDHIAKLESENKTLRQQISDIKGGAEEARARAESLEKESEIRNGN